MTDQPRPPATSSIQAAGRVAEDVITGLKGQPILLSIVLLNIFGIGAALWFLNKLANNNAASFQLILRACLPHASP
jgi:hypothetical protein